MTFPGGIPLQKILKFVLSVAAVGLLAHFIDWREFFRVVADARLGILLIAAIFLFLENMVVAWRWKVLLAPLGIHTSFMPAFRSYAKGIFVSYFVPAAITSDVVKAVDFNRAHLRGIEVLSSIFMERVCGAMSVAVMVLTGLAASPLVEGQAGLREALLLSALGVIAACAASLFADKFIGLIPAGLLSRFPKVTLWLERSRESFKAYRRHPRALTWAMALSLLIQSMRVGPIFLIALAIGAGTKLYPFMIAVPVIFLINMVPVIGSRIGTEQGMFVLLLAPAGITAESALAVAVVSLVLGVLVSLPGGYWLLKAREQGEKDEGQS